MRYEARLTAYDVMDSIHVSLAVYRDTGSLDGPTAPVVTIVTTVPGTGEPDPYRWTTDALVAALEAL